MGGIGCQTFSSNSLRVIYGKPRTLRAQRCSTSFEQRCMQAPLLNEFPIISTNAAARIDCYGFACGTRVLTCLQMNPEKRIILPSMAFRGFMSRYKKPELNEGFQDITEVAFRVCLSHAINRSTV